MKGHIVHQENFVRLWRWQQNLFKTGIEYTCGTTALKLHASQHLRQTNSSDKTDSVNDPA
ncbi:MAG: hypothetical protein OEY57_14905 [Nitrospirota bacterium]|nr:hypothetical protein [Nitrospirota bacterium]